MDGKLEEAMKLEDKEKLAIELQKGELIGKSMRGNQSVARAAEVSSTTKRKVKAHAGSERKPALDREALIHKLTQIERKVEQASLRSEPDAG
jgi:hypothetical protein